MLLPALHAGPELTRRGAALVFLNGNILGLHRRPHRFVASFRELRRRGLVGEFVHLHLQVGSI